MRLLIWLTKRWFPLKRKSFFNQIEIYVQQYAKDNNTARLSVLRLLEDESVIQILDRLVRDKKYSLEVRIHSMKLMSEDIDKLLLVGLDKDIYMDILSNEDEIELKIYALMLYSKILSLTPTEIVRKNFSKIQDEEMRILNYIINKEEDLELRLASVWALKANRLRGITIIELFVALEDLVFDTSENIDIRNGALEVLCEQSIYFKDLSMVENIFKVGIKKFEEEILLNAIFFIGQYGYSEFLVELREITKNIDNTHIKAMAIIALADLKDGESLKFLYDTFLNDSDEYIKEICVESIIKIEPRLLLQHKDLEIDGEKIVYRELCRYVVENNVILRRDEFLEEQYEHDK